MDDCPIPKVDDVDITPKRKQLIASAWNASPVRQRLGWWEAYFDHAADDPFMNGTGPYETKFRPIFDDLLQDDRLNRVYEWERDRERQRPELRVAS